MSRLTINFNLILLVLLHFGQFGEYSKCPVSQMQAGRCLHHWSIPSSTMFCSTPRNTR